MKIWSWIKNHIPFCAAMVSMLVGFIAMALGSMVLWFVCFFIAACLAGISPDGKNIK